MFSLANKFLNTLALMRRGTISKPLGMENLNALVALMHRECAGRGHSYLNENERAAARRAFRRADTIYKEIYLRHGRKVWA